MTEKQSNFIARLVSEKELPADEPRRAEYVQALVAGTAPQPNPQQASRIIEWLLALPNRPGVAAYEPDPDVRQGRYALRGDDGTVKFYAVDRPQEGRWAGRTFLSALGSDEKYPIRNRQARREILTAIAADPLTAMHLYGTEIGRCACCGRTLTDELSRASGVGPDCAANYGIDREALASRSVDPAQRDEAERHERIPAERTDGDVTVYVNGGVAARYDEADEAVRAARALFAEEPLRRITVARGADLIVEYDL